jgi:hypothetical protein
MSTHKKALFLSFLLVVSAAAAVADDPCPCFATGFMWLADGCQTWNCAASAMVLANGDPHLLVVPTASNNYKWVVLRRVVSGSVAVSPDAPFVVQSFQSMSDGTANFATIGSDRAPLMMTTADGNVLVISLREPERTRAARH